MGTMGGMNYEFVMLHQQMAKTIQNHSSHIFCFSQITCPLLLAFDTRIVPLVLPLSFSFCGG